jgi:hypothetical protein
MFLLVNSRVRNTLFVLMLALVLMGSLVACGNNNGAGTSSFNKNPPTISLETATLVTTSPSTVMVSYTVTEQSANFFSALGGPGIKLICTVTPTEGSPFENTVAMADPSQGLEIKGDLSIQNNGGDVKGPFNAQCHFDTNIGAQPSNILQACSGTPLRQDISTQSMLLNDVISVDCTAPPADTPVPPTDTPTTTSGTGTDPYYIFSINASGPNIVVGTQSDVAKPSCNFTDGGVCHDGNANVQVYETLGGPYDTLDQATQAYCQMVTNVRSYFGGYKGTINGKDYWLDNAPACS